MKVRRSFPQVYRFTRRNGSVYWLGSARSARWHMNERKTFPTEKEALDWARGIEESIDQHGGQSDVPKEKVVMADAYAKLVSRLTPYSKTPEEAVGFFLTHLGNEAVRQAKPFIRTLVDKWQEFKKADTTLSKRTLTEIRSYARFIKRKWGDLKPDDLKKNDIDLLFKKLEVSNNTRRKYLRYVRMFLSWVKDEGHLLQNPTDGLYYQPDGFNGDFYTPEVTKKLLRYVVHCEKDLAGYYALLTFAGLRPSEGARVQWSDYNWKTHQLKVRKGKTNARHVMMEPVAQEWMKFHRANTSQDAPFINLSSLANREKRVRNAVLNGDWIQDGLRHGFGTYYKELTKNIEKVADYMGNSPDIVKRHYARTVPKEDCDAFWGLTPAVVSANEQGKGDAAVAPDKADKPTPAIKTSDCVIKTASVQIASPAKKTEVHFVPMNTSENALP